MQLSEIKVKVITDNFYLYYGICLLLKKSYKSSAYIVERIDQDEFRIDEDNDGFFFIFDIDSLRDSFLMLFKHGSKSFFIVSDKNQRVFRDGFKVNVDAGLDEFRRGMMEFFSIKPLYINYEPILSFSSERKYERLSSIDKEVILRTLHGQNVNEISGVVRKNLKTTYGYRRKSLEKLGVSGIHGLHSVKHVVLGFLLK